MLKFDNQNKDTSYINKLTPFPFLKVAKSFVTLLKLEFKVLSTLSLRSRELDRCVLLGRIWGFNFDFFSCSARYCFTWETFPVIDSSGILVCSSFGEVTLSSLWINLFIVWIKQRSSSNNWIKKHFNASHVIIKFRLWYYVNMFNLTYMVGYHLIPRFHIFWTNDLPCPPYQLCTHLLYLPVKMFKCESWFGHK